MLKALADRSNNHAQVLGDCCHNHAIVLQVLADCHHNCVIVLQVLAGCTLAFSGLFPQSVSLYHSTAYSVATKLGATISVNVDEKVTHLVASRLG